MTSDPRTDELASNLEGVRQRVRAAALAADRDPDEVALIVVTKFFPAEDVARLVDLGVTDVGENRHQEASGKAAECAARDVRPRWHFIGGIQSNKAAAVAEYADVVESVDRAKVLRGLVNGVERAERDPLDVLIQVSLDPPDADHRFGVAPDGLAELASIAAESPHVRLRGLMAVAPNGEDPSVAFTRLADIRGEFLGANPDADILSAGMSGDLEQAIAHGATHVRVGSAILGSRPPLG